MRFTSRWEAVVGLHTQYFKLTGKCVLEPRLSTRFQLSQTASIGAAYGKHSRIEKLQYYFIDHDGKGVNKILDFGKCHHLVLNLQSKFGSHAVIKVEPYIQWLYDLPGIPDSSFSLINSQNDWFFNQPLSNGGKGKNLGFDLTFERFLNHGYYYLFTTSFFKSTYHGGDNIWRPTRYNRNYVFNGLVGKEWQIGPQHQHLLGLNIRATYQDGEHVTPLNQSRSHREQKIYYLEKLAFAEQLDLSLVLHFAINLRLNRTSHASIWSLSVINATGVSEFNGYQYNLVSHSIDVEDEILIVPNLAYRIEF